MMPAIRYHVPLLTALLCLSLAASAGAQTGPGPATGTAGVSDASADTASDASEREWTMLVIKGDVVNVRSGPGEYYYRVAQLTDGTPVKAYGQISNWVAIAPPASVEAVMRARDVIRGDDPTVGMVRVQNARVYAEDPASDRRWAVIRTLDIDTPVTILRDESHDYLAIEMPDRAMVYVSRQYVAKPVEPTMAPAGNGTPPTNTTPMPPTANGGAARPLPEGVPALRLDPQTDAYKEAAEMLTAELEKPLMQRDYEAAETALRDVLDNATEPYLKAQVEGDLGTIRLHRELQEGLRQLEEEKRSVEQWREMIRKQEQEREARELGQVTDEMTAPAHEGVLKKMMARISYDYRLEDAEGRFVCLLDVPAELSGKVAGLLGRRVQVWGESRYNVELKTHVCKVERLERAK